MSMKTVFIFILFFFVSTALNAQDDANGLTDLSVNRKVQSDFEQASVSVQQKLEESIAELNNLRQQIAEEKVPLSRKLSELEGELSRTRLEYQKTIRLLDSRTLDLSNLRSEIKSRQEEATYISNLLGEYIRNFESRLHIAEVQRYRAQIESAKLAPENSNLTELEIYKAQTDILSVSLKRLNDTLGGTRFDGTASDSSGSIHHGTFVLLGPAAIFQSDDGRNVGVAEQRLGSLEPSIIPFRNESDAEAAERIIVESRGFFPIDPTLGNAHKIEATKETILQHIQKGGPVMYPIFVLAGASLLVAFFKWVSLVFIRKPSQKQTKALIRAVAEHDEQAVAKKVKAIKGPVGEMLTCAVEHIKEPRELIEEVMYEKVLATRLKLERFLPFIAISAAAAPLLGLLGTVTGIINTFKLITVFGSGDVKTLSGGISEALITTEFGLIVAIPSLLLHAFLSRKAKGVINEMEKAAVAFINQISKTPYYKKEETDLLGKMVVGQARGIVNKITHEEQPSDVISVRKFSEDTAGALMSSGVLSMQKNYTVAEAIDKLRKDETVKDIDSIFIVDEKGKYLGQIPIHKLLTRPENALLESLAETHAHFVRIDTSRDEIHSIFSKNSLNNMPVLDYEDRLVGTVSRNGQGRGK